MQWVVENFGNIQEEKLYSETFDVCGYSWWVSVSGTHVWVGCVCKWTFLRAGLLCSRRLLLFPKGSGLRINHLSVYLDFAEASYTPEKMCPKAHFEIVAVNQHNRMESRRKGEHSRLCVSCHITLEASYCNPGDELKLSFP